MHDFSEIKGLIFDYGGTLDANGKHWLSIFWDAYSDAGVPVGKADFTAAYIAVERHLEAEPLVKSDCKMKELLDLKTGLQLKWLSENGFLAPKSETSLFFLAISNHCYNFVVDSLKKTIPVLRELTAVYPAVLASNFYGNLNAVLDDFSISHYFKGVIESAAIGIRKPNPEIFRIALDSLGLKPSETAVIGDSLKNDILPAKSLGCTTIWLKNCLLEEENYPESAADSIIGDFGQLIKIFFNNDWVVNSAAKIN
ncbi:MAG: HAD family hydrolase [Dysgonamonadaceae bacterium]|jgi:putative hydrolase of the HAD superfamily|nr:HAD family hydrolase [Dysgonamonadaceae bacterium]